VFANYLYVNKTDFRVLANPLVKWEGNGAIRGRERERERETERKANAG
jgi:hypothetical protein